MFGDVLVAVYLLAAGLTAGVAWRTARGRRAPGAKPFSAAMVAVACWALLAAIEQTLTLQQTLVLSVLYRLEWIPMTVLGVAWLAFGLAYAGRERHLTRRRIAAASAVPAVVAVVALFHGSVIQVVEEAVGASSAGSLLVAAMWAVESAWSVLSVVGTGYLYLLVAVGSLFLLEVLFERRSPHPGQALILLVVAPPWILNVLHLSNVVVVSSFDPTILGFVASGIVGAVVVGRFRLFEVPLARARIVEEMGTAVLVSGLDGRLYDYNDRAASLLDLSTDDLGRDFGAVLAESPLDVEAVAGTASSQSAGSDDAEVSERSDDSDRDPGSDRRSGSEPPSGTDPMFDGGTSSLAGSLDGRTLRVDAGTGTPTYVEGRVSETTDVFGRPVGTVLGLYEVTDRELARRELERSRDRYRALFENDQVVFWEFDLSGAVEDARRMAAETDDLAAYLDENPGELQALMDAVEVTDVNRTGLEFYGADSRTELIENLESVFTEKALDSWKDLWATVAAGGRNFRMECTAATLDGDRRIVLSDLIVPDSAMEDYSRVYMTALDVTDRIERERELERTNEYLDELVRVVSHDVATPLNVVENKARLVEMTGDPSHAADIYDATERVQELVDDLHDLAREGKRVGTTTVLDLGTVARDAWTAVETGEATLTIVESTDVEANETRLQQLFENLLENAVEHGATGSPPEADNGLTVRIGTTPDGFYVADDGPGIPEEHRSRVFDGEFSTDEDGRGLGLAIVERVVEGHGWTIDVTESADGGARFEIRTDQ